MGYRVMGVWGTRVVGMEASTAIREASTAISEASTAISEAITAIMGQIEAK